MEKSIYDFCIISTFSYDLESNKDEGDENANEDADSNAAGDRSDDEGDVSDRDGDGGDNDAAGSDKDDNESESGVGEDNNDGGVDASTADNNDDSGTADKEEDQVDNKVLTTSEYADAKEDAEEVGSLIVDSCGNDFRKAFDMFDLDGSGKISATEFGTVMRSLGQNPTDEEIDNMLKVSSQG